MVVGAAMLPKLNVQYSPRTEQTSISVSFGYGSASPRVVEQEVTSKIEGALSVLDGVVDVSATSYSGGGYVSLRFKKGTNMEAARFAVATQIRQIYPKLPEGVSYPSVSGSVSGGEGNKTLLSYTINADMPADKIVKLAKDLLVTPLSRIEGVEEVNTSGAVPFEWYITFDPNSLRAVGLTPDDLSGCFNEYFQNTILGSMVIEDKLMLLRLKSADLNVELEKIPVRKVNGRLFYLGDFAKIEYKEQQPNYYSRYNGLNTINLVVSAAEDINSIDVAQTVKDKVEELKGNFPDKFAIQLDYDASVELQNEINKIFKRSILSLVILLVFVFLVSRSTRYLSVIALAITANLLAAVILYYFLGIDIEIYSMAGITVSLGIIIDTAIVMADHYSYYKNRSVSLSILGALLTTIAALLIIFFLPDYQKQDLVNFVWVIVINLSLSFVIALLFIPALLEKIHLTTNKGVTNSSYKYKRRLVDISDRYERYIVWGRNHRWIFILLLVLGFGLPLKQLPSRVYRGEEYIYNSKLGYYEYNPKANTGLAALYNKTIGSEWYQKNRHIFEAVLGGSFNWFSKAANGSSYYRNPSDSNRRTLDVSANMPEGCNAQQMNEIIKEMENWLSQFDEIEYYTSSVSNNSGYLEIKFKKEYARGAFPYFLKQQLWDKARSYGGATWYVSALDENDRSLSNSVYTTSFDHSITLYGYNYDMLYRFADELIDSLKANKRVTDAGLQAGSYGGSAGSEYSFDLDKEKIVRNGMNVSGYISYLNQQLYESTGTSVFDGQERVPVHLVSADKDYFDLWHISNDMIVIDSVPTRLSDIGSITKSKTAVNITRSNQEYTVTVGYNFIGSYDLNSRMLQKRIDYLNKTLPMGFSAGHSSQRYWSDSDKRRQAGLILLVVAIIYMICAVMYESLLKPLVIISMIPIGLIGLFISFPLLNVNFDQGGYAAIVMLCGIVVNAGIYILSEFGTISSVSRTSGIRRYIKAYNRKIVPTLLTIISTVLGLIPFLFDGKTQTFWYAFAIGVMGGMLFSVIALVFFFPIFMPLKEKKVE